MHACTCAVKVLTVSFNSEKKNRTYPDIDSKLLVLLQ